jgi:RNA polymerase sigma-70 factor, ECF subfamily
MRGEIGDLLQQRRYDEALERLLDLYETKVLRMAMAMLRDAGRAEEITQDVFLKVWQAFPSYDGRAAVSTWLYAIARNACLSALRAESYRRTSPLDQAPEPAVPAAQPAVPWGRYLSRLPEPQRQVITLFYFQDRNVRDVAATLNIPEGTVKSLLHRARRALGEMME